MGWNYSSIPELERCSQCRPYIRRQSIKGNILTPISSVNSWTKYEAIIVAKFILKLRLDIPPGNVFRYLTGSTGVSLSRWNDLQIRFIANRKKHFKSTGSWIWAILLPWLLLTTKSLNFLNSHNANTFRLEVVQTWSDQWIRLQYC